MGGTSLFGWMEPSHFDKEAAYFLLETAPETASAWSCPACSGSATPWAAAGCIQNKSMFKDLADYMEEFHKTGSKLFIQLAAGCGRSMAVTDMDRHVP